MGHKSYKNWGLPIVLVVLIATGALVYFRWFKTYHYAEVTPGVLYRDGMRNTWEFGRALKLGNIKTVVSLVTDEEVADPSKGNFQGEARLLEARGIELVRLPIKTGGPPSEADIEKFLSVVTDKDRQPVLVHCAQGIVRTGMMVAVYQKNVLGYDKEQALDAIDIFGKGSNRADRVKWFIENYYGQDAEN